MSNGPERRCERGEEACLLALGALDGAEASELLTLHVVSCAECRAEIEQQAAAVAELGLAAQPVTPPAELLERLRARLGLSGASPGTSPSASPGAAERELPRNGSVRQPWKRWPSDAKTAMSLVRGTAGGWEPSGVDGVEVRRLFVDHAGDRITMLIRMAPGSAYPPHVHGGDEECFVVEGKLMVEDVPRQAGDYQFAPAGTRHGVQSTATGCTLLITSSAGDELTS
jgi:anti-sigma factor ChrR (cupin superfamily)